MHENIHACLADRRRQLSIDSADGFMSCSHAQDCLCADVSARLDEVAQEVLLRLIRHDPSGAIEDPRGWLLKTAAEFANAEAIGDVEQALANLSVRQRTVLRMQFAEGMKRAEIALRLGSTPDLIKEELLRSYRKLREQLPPTGCK